MLYKAGGASLPADSIACGDEHGSHTGLCKELRAIAIFAPSVTGSHPWLVTESGKEGAKVNCRWSAVERRRCCESDGVLSEERKSETDCEPRESEPCTPWAKAARSGWARKRGEKQNDRFARYQLLRSQDRTLRERPIQPELAEKQRWF